MKTYKTLYPVLPIKGSTQREMALYLEISASMLYKIIKEHYVPGIGIKRRITNRTGLPLSIWELDTHEYTRLIYNQFRQSQVTAGKADPRSAPAAFEHSEDKRLIEITEIL